MEVVLPAVVLAGDSRSWAAGIAPATAICIAGRTCRLEQHGLKIDRHQFQLNMVVRWFAQSQYNRRVSRVDKAYRKPFGGPFLNVQASQVPVQLCASDRNCSSRWVEGASSATSAATSSSSCCHLRSILISKMSRV